MLNEHQRINKKDLRISVEDQQQRVSFDSRPNAPAASRPRSAASGCAATFAHPLVQLLQIDKEGVQRRQAPRRVTC